MSAKTYPLNIKWVLDDEWMDCLIEQAGYGMSYWATEMFEPDDDHLVVRWFDESDGTPHEKRVTRGALARGAQKILKGETNLNDRNVQAVYRAVQDAGDIDADVADNVVQAALFGEIVYG